MQLLEAFMFPGKFVQWVQACVCSTRYSLIINGECTGFIRGHKRLRQGDPISLFLFVLIMEYLTRLLVRNTMGTAFRFHPGCKRMHISSMCFADDLLLFSQGKMASVQLLLDAFHEFFGVSGLVANPSKSCVYFAGVTVVDQMLILEQTGFQKG